MSDWNSFFRSDDFKAYRKKQVQAVADSIKKDVFQIVNMGSVDVAVFYGKMQMANILLKLPERLTNDKELKELLTIQRDEDVSNITKYLIRQSLTEE